MSVKTIKPGTLIQISDITRDDWAGKPDYAALYFEDDEDPKVVDRLTKHPILASVINGMIAEYIKQSKAHDYRIAYVFDLDAQILLNDQEFVILNEG